MQDQHCSYSSHIVRCQPIGYETTWGVLKLLCLILTSLNIIVWSSTSNSFEQLSLISSPGWTSSGELGMSVKINIMWANASPRRTSGLGNYMSASYNLPYSLTSMAAQLPLCDERGFASCHVWRHYKKALATSKARGLSQTFHHDAKPLPLFLASWSLHVHLQKWVLKFLQGHDALVTCRT
jgi:hypothetical protein